MENKFKVPVANTFNRATITNIYVPDESIEDYKAATNWSALSGKIKPISEFVELQAS